MVSETDGRDLTLAEPVISGKDGMSVCLSSESSLFTGPSDPQREQFFVYSAEQHVEMILGSIQKAPQEGFAWRGPQPRAQRGGSRLEAKKFPPERSFRRKAERSRWREFLSCLVLTKKMQTTIRRIWFLSVVYESVLRQFISIKQSRSKGREGMDAKTRPSPFVSVTRR